MIFTEIFRNLCTDNPNHFSFVILLLAITTSDLASQEVEVMGSLKVAQMDTINSEALLVVKTADGTLATREVSSLPPPPVSGSVIKVAYHVNSTRVSLPTSVSITMESFLYNKISPTSFLIIQGTISGFGNHAGAMQQGWKLGAGSEVLAQSLVYDENNFARTFPTTAIIAGHSTTGPQIMTFRYFSSNADGTNRPFNVYNPNSTDDARLGQTRSVYVIYEVEP